MIQGKQTRCLPVVEAGRQSSAMANQTTSAELSSS